MEYHTVFNSLALAAAMGAGVLHTQFQQDSPAPQTTHLTITQAPVPAKTPPVPAKTPPVPVPQQAAPPAKSQPQTTQLPPPGTRMWATLTNRPGWYGWGELTDRGTIRVTAYRHRSLGSPLAQPATIGFTQQAGQFVQQATGWDPTGFLAQLNAVRAQYGLRPVSYDPNAAAVAAQNNAAQRARGLGHHVTGGYAQNSAVGGGDPMSMWLNSPGHRALILNPNLQSAGFASDGYAHTLNATGHTGGLVQRVLGDGRVSGGYQGGSPYGVAAHRQPRRWFGR